MQIEKQPKETKVMVARWRYECPAGYQLYQAYYAESEAGKNIILGPIINTFDERQDNLACVLK